MSNKLTNALNKWFFQWGNQETNAAFVEVLNPDGSNVSFGSSDASAANQSTQIAQGVTITESLVDGSGTSVGLNLKNLLDKTLARGVVGSSGNLTRPNNTTAYTAGDVVHGAFEITGLGLANQLVQINRAVLKIQVATNPGNAITTFKLIAHSATPPSAIAENGVYTPTGDGLVYQLTASSESVLDKGDWLQAEFVLFDGNGFAKLSSTGSLFCYLVTDAAYTPTALAVKTVDLYVVGM